ncbi:MAG TPA: 4Fe-4S double cluster binding domain-containing protein [Thermodesulfovibrionales bacterium]|nr:4Fe-4S double cluster binding domain-containing protein [Thermodesulfovibrionales bacterium]
MNAILREELLRSGAVLVGFACVKGILGKEIAHLERAVSISVDRNLNQDTVHLLLALQKTAARQLRGGGYRYLCIPPDSDRIRNTFVSKLYPLFTHKIAATSAGIGWIGKNGLLINREFGPRLSLATVLTDAPLETGSPIESSQCGECRLCLEFCPSDAITGEDWSRSNPFVELVQSGKCESHKKNTKTLNGKPNCGLCINICPYGRKNGKSKST